MFQLWLARVGVNHSQLLVPCDSLQQALNYGSEYAGLCGLQWRMRRYNGRKVYKAKTQYGDVLNIVCHGEKK